MNIPLQKLSGWFRKLKLWATGDWQFITMCPLNASHLVQTFLAKYQITQATQPTYSQDLAPCNLWLFPKLKSPLKGKGLQNVEEIQENTMGQLMVTGRTVWGSKAPKCLYFFIYYMSEYLMDRPHIWKFESGIAIHVFSLPTTLILKTNSSIEMFSNDNNH